MQYATQMANEKIFKTLQNIIEQFTAKMLS